MGESVITSCENGVPGMGTQISGLECFLLTRVGFESHRSRTWTWHENEVETLEPENPWVWVCFCTFFHGENGLPRSQLFQTGGREVLHHRKWRREAGLGSLVHLWTNYHRRKGKQSDLSLGNERRRSPRRSCFRNGWRSPRREKGWQGSQAVVPSNYTSSIVTWKEGTSFNEQPHWHCFWVQLQQMESEILTWS